MSRTQKLRPRVGALRAAVVRRTNNRRVQRHQRGNHSQLERAGTQNRLLWDRNAPRDVPETAGARMRLQAGGDQQSAAH